MFTIRPGEKWGDFGLYFEKLLRLSEVVDMSLFSRFACVALLGASALPAVTITGYTLQFQGVTVPAGDFPGTISVPASTGSYDVTGNLDLYENGLPVKPNVPLSGPFSFRFTNALITCASGPCSPVTLSFAAFVSFSGLAPTNVGGVFGADGVLPGNRSIEVGVEGSPAPLLISNVTNDGESFSVSAPFPAGFVLTSNPNTMIFLMGLKTTSGLGDGEAIFLPDSLFQQLNTVSDVPEPGTLAIVGAGLAGVIWFRRRLS